MLVIVLINLNSILYFQRDVHATFHTLVLSHCDICIEFDCFNVMVQVDFHRFPILMKMLYWVKLVFSIYDSFNKRSMEL